MQLRATTEPSPERLLLSALLTTETTDTAWLCRVVATELAALRAEHSAASTAGWQQLWAVDPAASLLVQARTKAAQAHLVPELARTAAFWQRLIWMLSPSDADATACLDPQADAERIFHSVAREFRTELKVFAVLHEMRAAVSLPLASFFLDTGEFSQRGVRRIVDTVLLVCNALEWGFDSVRGRYCIDRINAVHAHYRIPNAAFKFVLAGIMFIPWEFNQRFGWRAMSDVERLGWFHAFRKLGTALHIDELNDDFDEMYAWYREVSEANARFAPAKRRLVEDILGQVLARYPKGVRALIGSAFVAGMDGPYLTASGLPAAPEVVVGGLRRLFEVVGHTARQRAGDSVWLQSLLTSSVYPDGYELEQLGVASRSAHLPTSDGRDVSQAELEARVAEGALWVVIDEHVYDLSHFASQHPGGGEVLRRYAGKDASAAFAAAPHSFATRWLRENYRVGRLAERSAAARTDAAEPRVVPPSTEQLATRRSRHLPQPEAADSLESWAEALLPLVNGRSRERLTKAEVLLQLRALAT